MRLSKPLKLALMLAVLVAVASALLVVGARLTDEQRTLSHQRYLIDQLAEVGIGGYDNNPLSQARKTADGHTVYPFYAGDAVLGYAIETVAPDGYSGEIHLLVGVDSQGEITAVRPLQHRETPGLGDRIEPRKGDWINGFGALRAGSPLAHWQVQKDGGRFDNLSGATITARAVLNQVRTALEETTQ